MDDSSIDWLARLIAGAGSRRGLVRLLAGLPVLAALSVLLGTDAAGADEGDPEQGGSHRRRKTRHTHIQNPLQRDRKHSQNQGRRNKKHKRNAKCPPSQTCQGKGGGVACGGAVCPVATQICVEGTCQDCDVCATCTHTTIKQAIDAVAQDATATIRICAGRYVRPSSADNVVDIQSKNLTLIGAGADCTIIDGKNAAADRELVRVVLSTSTLRHLTVRGSKQRNAIDTSEATTLTLEHVTVRNNDARPAGGAGINNSGTLFLNEGTVICGNIANYAGGILNSKRFGDASLTVNGNASVTGNTATDGNGGGIYNGFAPGGSAFTATVTLNSGSITGNTAKNKTFGHGRGGGIFNEDGSIEIDEQVTFAKNQAVIPPNDCANADGSSCL
jgi:hypothetical protein